MHNSNNSALSKDTIFGASNHTSINSVFSSTSSLEDISVAKAKEALSKKLVAVAACFRNESGSLSSVKTGSN